MKVTLWNKEVDLDFTEKQIELNRKELNISDEVLAGSTHGYFASPCSGLNLHYREYLPAGKPKGVVVWQHGVADHSGNCLKLKDGRITNTALLSSEFIKEGFALYTPDLIGHGLSEGRRCFIPNWETNRDDLYAFCRFASSKHPGIPCFVTGESYGACLAIHVARKWQDDKDCSDLPLKGIGLLAPAIIGDLPPYPVVFVLRYMLAPIFPQWTPFFMPNPVSSERIWKDPEVLAEHTSDHQRDLNLSGAGLPFQLGTGVALLCALEAVRSEDVIGSLTVPFVVAHGTQDDAVPIAGTEYLLEHAKTPEKDRSVRRVDGGFHDLLAEPAPSAEETTTFLVDWVKKRALSS